MNRNSTKLAIRHARLHVAAPGGVVVRANRVVLGDPVGLSAWTDFSKRVVYQTRALEHTLLDENATTITLQLGRGWWEDPKGSGAVAKPYPAARVLVTIEDEHGNVTRFGSGCSCRSVGGGTKASTTRHHCRSGSVVSPELQPLLVEGREGAVVNDSIYLGTTIDWRVGESEGWHEAKTLTAGAPLGVLVPLSTPAPREWGDVKPISVVRIGHTSWHYTMPANMVGSVIVHAGSYIGPGRLRLEHCERLVPNASTPTCVVLHGLEGGVVDEHILPLGTGRAHALLPRFTWHGFQHVLVSAHDGATFDGSLTALTARWTTAALESSSTLSFSPDGGGGTLNTLHHMVTASQRSNMAAHVPTDCPNREKRGWLGDAHVTAEEAHYNLWVPTVHRLFLDMIRDNQVSAMREGQAGEANRNASYDGFVPGVAPSTTMLAPGGAAMEPGDLGFTSAYVLMTRWLLLYYGDIASVREHWLNLKRWCLGALRIAASMRPDGLPDFYTWGDWSAFEARAIATPGTGPQVSAASFLIALQAMVHMAKALNETVDEATFGRLLATMQATFDARYWNGTLGAWVGSRPPEEHQTLAALALAALEGASVTAVRREATATLLASDVVKRGHHVTVGSAGQKWLLRTLSASRAHDDAVLLASQTSYPSWGHWAQQGATTCWENWSGLPDPSHPPEPTHNHIFLCGGLGEWLHRSLGGISPLSDGYAQVKIAPHISRSVGPSAANASVMTIRGRITASWVRGSSISADAVSGRSKHELLLTLRVRIPVGVDRARVTLPLVGRRASNVSVTDAGPAGPGSQIWPATLSPSVVSPGILSVGVDTSGIEEALSVLLLSGDYIFEVYGL